MSAEQGNGSAPADDGEGLALGAKRRESALERLKKALAERELPAPKLEGYSLHKARKILALTGVAPERLRVRLTDHYAPRGTVVAQRPAPGAMVDLEDEAQRIEVTVADASIVDYLPQLYQRSDITGRSFIRNFLWVFQHLQFQTDSRLRHLEHYFDPHECPADFLEYLASWVALTLESDWPETKKRSLIKKAVELYHLRGTPRGLRVYLRIFTGVNPEILENVWPYDGCVVGQSFTVGVDTVVMHEVNRAHTFVVKIPLPIEQVDAATILRIHRIIEQEKPVHTDYYLTFAEPDAKDDDDTGITVGVTSTVGVDMWLKGEEAEEFDPLGGDGEMESAEDE